MGPIERVLQKINGKIRDDEDKVKVLSEEARGLPMSTTRATKQATTAAKVEFSLWLAELRDRVESLPHEIVRRFDSRISDLPPDVQQIVLRAVKEALGTFETIDPKPEPDAPQASKPGRPPGLRPSTHPLVRPGHG